MNRKVVFVEGKNDLAVFEKLLESKGFKQNRKPTTGKSEKVVENEKGDKIKLFALNGWSSIKNENFLTDVKQFTEEGYKCYVIIDADYTEIDEGGFTIRKKVVESRLMEVKKSLSEANPSICFFLLPDNQNDGNLETIIKKTIGEEYQPVYDCLKNYIDCLCNIALSGYKKGKRKGLNTFCIRSFLRS